MEIVIVAIIGIGIYYFISMRCMTEMNNDPKQQALALIFIVGGESYPQDAEETATGIKNIIAAEGWSRTNASTRLAHALSMVRVMRPDVYKNAVEISRCGVLRSDT